MTRVQQRDATRRLLVDAAVETLIAKGYAATTTLEVQRRAGVSRGALLHHFPTRQALFGAAVAGLVERNERAVREALAAVAPGADPVARALHVLRAALLTPSFGAELELWTAARTDPGLRAELRRAEGAARRDLYRVIDEVVGPRVTASPAYPVIADLTVQLLRGIAISDVLYRDGAGRGALLDQWAGVVRLMLKENP
ncbi:TetR/AcrR family transcriptional regulator [Actinomadura kijaniata]|uniref:TetR/AcrR family transcriptional regulator n=1 Tax=Actinomadura kijaniata TaxID=46161 RepID=UPI003F1B6A65